MTPTPEGTGRLDRPDVKAPARLVNSPAHSTLLKCAHGKLTMVEPAMRPWMSSLLVLGVD